MPQRKNTLKLDKTVFIVSSGLVLSIALLLFIFPESSKQVISVLMDKILGNFGFIYTWAGIASVAVCLYFAFSKYGKIRFGDPDEKPEFTNFTWAATLFTAGIAVAILYWGPIEWVSYYLEPALGVEPGSELAAEWAQAYDLFHWGPIPWALYSICALPIGYSYYTRKKPVMKVSETCRDIIGDQSNKLPGKVIDILFIIAILMGQTVEIGSAMPLITAGFCTIFHLEPNPIYNYIILGTVTVVFAVAAYMGLKKGITRLGRINYVLAIVILLFVFIVGPTVFILKMTTTSTGLFAQNFIRMATWMEPVGTTGFVEHWTQFYWAWWMSAGLFMGMFIARMSRGRTVRSVLIGSIFWGTAGCGAFFWILGGFTMNLQFTGKLDVIGMISQQGESMTIMECLKQLPMSTILIIAYSICGILFLATTLNSMTTGISSVCLKNLQQGDDPDRKLVLYWSVVIVLLPCAMFSMDADFSIIQSATIVGSLPVSVVMVILTLSFVKMVKTDRYFEQHK